jgi:hypothetical protein
MENYILPVVFTPEFLFYLYEALQKPVSKESLFNICSKRSTLIFSEQ